MFRTVFAAVFLAALTPSPPRPPPPRQRSPSGAILPAAASAPAPGERQPVGGFSALLDAPGRDTYFAMPDNGFGTKANSRSFLLRLYRVRANWDRAAGATSRSSTGSRCATRTDGSRSSSSTRTRASLLTGADFDIESVRRDRRGDLWFGDEFGPFLLHTDARGVVLEAPIPLPGVRSPDSPAPTATPNLARSNGFEGMAISPDGRTLYPTLEGPLAGDADTSGGCMRSTSPSAATWAATAIYRVADASHLVSDLTALDSRRFVALERDNVEGPDAAHKQAFVVERVTAR